MGRTVGLLLILEPLAQRQENVGLVGDSQGAFQLEDMPVQIQSFRNVFLPLGIEAFMGGIGIDDARVAIGQSKLQFVRYAPRKRSAQLVELALQIQRIAVLHHFPGQLRRLDVRSVAIVVVQEPVALDQFQHGLASVPQLQGDGIPVGDEVPIGLLVVVPIRIEKIALDAKGIGVR